MYVVCEKCLGNVKHIGVAAESFFQCIEEKCKHQSKSACRARSSCCFEDIEVLEAGAPYPLICSRCLGACEIADPKTPDFEEDVAMGFREIVSDVAAGKLDKNAAVSKLWTLTKEKTDRRAEELSLKIAQAVERQMPIPVYIPDTLHRTAHEGICKGYELAVRNLQEEIGRIIK